MAGRITYPWTSFRAFIEAIVKFENLPEVVNYSKFENEYNKTYAAQFSVMLRFLGFTDEQSKPTDLFIKFIAEKNNRSQLLADAMKRSYKDVFSQVSSTKEISNDLLEKVFTRHCSPGEHKKRAIGFFKMAAEYANIQIQTNNNENNPDEVQLQPKVTRPDMQLPALFEKIIEDMPILAREIPPIGEPWSQENRAKWIKLLEGAISYYYPRYQ